MAAGGGLLAAIKIPVALTHLPDRISATTPVEGPAPALVSELPAAVAPGFRATPAVPEIVDSPALTDALPAPDVLGPSQPGPFKDPEPPTTGTSPRVSTDSSRSATGTAGRDLPGITKRRALLVVVGVGLIVTIARS